MKPDSTVAVRPVTLGVVDGERAAIASGLAAGDVVVTEGGDRLRDGAQSPCRKQHRHDRPRAAPASAPPAGTHPGAAKGTRRAHPRPNPSQ